MDPIPVKLVREILSFLSCPRGEKRTAHQQYRIDRFFEEFFRPHGCVLPLAKVREQFAGQSEVVAIYQQILAEQHSLAVKPEVNEAEAPAPGSGKRRKRSRRSIEPPEPAEREVSGSRTPRTLAGGVIGILADRASDEQFQRWSQAQHNAGGWATVFARVRKVVIVGLVFTSGWLAYRAWQGGRGAAEKVGTEVQQIQEKVGHFARGSAVDPVRTPLPKNVDQDSEAKTKPVAISKASAPSR